MEVSAAWVVQAVQFCMGGSELPLRFVVGIFLNFVFVFDFWFLLSELHEGHHCPAMVLHSRLAMSEPTETLEELTEFFERFRRIKVTIGMDANTRLAGINDGYRFGPSVPDCSLNVGQVERSVILHELLARRRNLPDKRVDR